ncbi:MAG TPA: AraC family transcriptional regulator [Polyangiaceae bacterium]|nr:AraC family transcriptional regulator [Polyangiaceae bacterium]
MSAPAAEAYRARFRKLLDYVDAHLDEALGLDRLSSMAAFSKFHFQRQFSELFGISLYKYVQLSRLKRAAYQLAFRGDSRILDIALASGYDGPESFARAFKKCVGQSPSEFRTQPAWAAWGEAYQPLKQMRFDHMTPESRSGQVQIIDFQETRVAVLEHHGDPTLLGDSIRKFIAWRRQNQLPPSVSATFNLAYNDPIESEPGEFRFDLCAATEREVTANPFGVVAKVIPGGRCAVLRHIGSDDNLGKVVTYLYSEWLPHSREELRDFPLFFQRVRFFPDVAEHEAVTDVFLPLR